MKKNLIYVLFVTCVVLYAQTPILCAEDDDPVWIKTYKSRWKEYVKENFLKGMTMTQIELKMKNLYLAKIVEPYAQQGEFPVDVYYRVDDLTEVVFSINKKGVLEQTPEVTSLNLWLRSPYDGRAWTVKRRASNKKKNEK